jgi:hypothetical protein
MSAGISILVLVVGSRAASTDGVFSHHSRCSSSTRGRTTHAHLGLRTACDWASPARAPSSVPSQSLHHPASMRRFGLLEGQRRPVRVPCRGTGTSRTLPRQRRSIRRADRLRMSAVTVREGRRARIVPRRCSRQSAKSPRTRSPSSVRAICAMRRSGWARACYQTLPLQGVEHADERRSCDTQGPGNVDLRRAVVLRDIRQYLDLRQGQVAGCPAPPLDVSPDEAVQVRHQGGEPLGSCSALVVHAPALLPVGGRAYQPILTDGRPAVKGT